MPASDFSRTQAVCHPVSGSMCFAPMFSKWVSCDTHVSGPLKCAKIPIRKIICAWRSFVAILLKHLSYPFRPLWSFISLAKLSHICMATGNNRTCTLSPCFAAIKIFSSIDTYKHLLVIYCSEQFVFWNFNIPYNLPHSSPLYCPLVCSFSVCATFLVDKVN